MSNISRQDSIYKLSYECESLFDQLVNHATTINPGLCAEFQQRFAIWASNLGVFVRKSQCLDTRLRSLPDLQDLVARLLDILRRSLLVLAKARSEDPDSMVLAGSEAQNRTNEIQSTAATIDDILNRLNRLGVRIRQSSNTKLGPRLQKFAAGFDLRPFEYLCAFTVHSLYPDTNQSLKDYLWKSMVKRYTTRLFMNSRQEKFKKRREPLASIPEVSSNEIETGVPGNQPMRANNNSIIPGLPKSPTISSQSDLSSYNIDKIRNHAKLPNEASTKRYKTSSVQIDQVNYPRLPIAEPDSTIRTCPWCAKHLNNTLSESDWRQHIDQDFEPYICLSERCSEAHPAFTTFDGWYKHMRLHSRRWHQRFHSASSWVCTVCEANPKAYNSPPALYSHLKRSHGDKFTNEQLEILSRQSKLDKPTAGNSCLLCCFIVEEQDIGDETVLQRRPTREVQQETPKGNILEITNPDTHSPSLSDTSSDSDISDPHQDQSQEQEYPSVAVARHIAAHLQTLMLLTLRFADVHNYNETLGDDIKSDPVEIHNTSEVLERNNLSRLSDVASLSDIIMKDSMENVESTEAPMDIDDYVEDERLIPDTDLDLSDIPRQYDRILPKNDDLLRGFVESGIYQPPHIKYEAVSPPISLFPTILTKPVTPTRHVMIPFRRNENFTGCDTIINQLLQILPPNANKNDCQRTVIEGLGGVGKTEIALEAAYRVLDEHNDCSVFWVPAGDFVNVRNSYRNIGRLLNIADIERDETNIETLVQTGLSCKSAGSWLLVIDNVDDTGGSLQSKALTDYLPFSLEGSILFTATRHETVASLHVLPRNTFTVEAMNDTEATKLLNIGLTKQQTYDTDGQKSLVNWLSNLPLAIRIASAFMSQNPDVMAKQYLDICCSLNITDTGDRISGHFETYREYHVAKSTVITWLVSFEHLLRYNFPAAEYLKFASLLGEIDIWPDLLPSSSSIAYEVLEAYALIINRRTSLSFDIHKLNRLFMQCWLREKGELATRLTALSHKLSYSYPTPHHDNREAWIKYLPHGQAVIKLSNSSYNTLSPDLASKVANSCSILWGYVPGNSIRNKVSSLSNLGFTHKKQGRYKEAERLLRQALKIQDEIGMRDRGTLDSMASLASVLQIQEKYEDAEEIYWRVLGLQKEIVGTEHLYTLACMCNLGYVLNFQGKHEQAEEIHRQALEQERKLLGEKHPNALNTMYCIAFALYSQKKFKEAEDLYQRTVKLMQEVLGTEHPNTLNTMSGLACTFYYQGNLEEAEKLCRLTLGIRQRVLGREHRQTVESMENLAVALNDQNKYAEAKELSRQVSELKAKRTKAIEAPHSLKNILDYRRTKGFNEQGQMGLRSRALEAPSIR